jgi:hypothetical protein
MRPWKTSVQRGRRRRPISESAASARPVCSGAFNKSLHEKFGAQPRGARRGARQRGENLPSAENHLRSRGANVGGPSVGKRAGQAASRLKYRPLRVIGVVRTSGLGRSENYGIGGHTAAGVASNPRLQKPEAGARGTAAASPRRCGPRVRACGRPRGVARGREEAGKTCGRKGGRLKRAKERPKTWTALAGKAGEEAGGRCGRKSGQAKRALLCAALEADVRQI